MKNQISHGATSPVQVSAQQSQSSLASTRRTRACPSRSGSSRSGKIKPAILLWALGVPIPFVLLFLLIRGCTG